MEEESEVSGGGDRGERRKIARRVEEESEESGGGERGEWRRRAS